MGTLKDEPSTHRPESIMTLLSLYENDKIKVTKKGKIKTTKIGYFFDCQKIV